MGWRGVGRGGFRGRLGGWRIRIGKSVWRGLGTTGEGAVNRMLLGVCRARRAPRLETMGVPAGVAIVRRQLHSSYLAIFCRVLVLLCTPLRSTGIATRGRRIQCLLSCSLLPCYNILS